MVAIPSAYVATSGQKSARRSSQRPHLSVVSSANGAQDDFSPLALAKALPKGSVRAQSQSAWLEKVAEASAFSHRRQDSYATLMAVAEVVALHASWESMTTRPTWAVLMERTEKSRSTIARALADLRAAGLLGIVQTGSTPETRPLALAHVEGNLAAVYVLAYPHTLEAHDAQDFVSVDIDDTPTDLSEGKIPFHAHARESSHHEPLRGTDLDHATREHESQPWRTGPLWSRHITPKRKDERLRAAWAVKMSLLGAKNLSDHALASLLRPFHLAGWTISDILYALDHRPDGTLWPHSGMQGVKHTQGWMMYRLSPWIDEFGTVRISHTQQIAADHALRLAQQRAVREHNDKQRAARASVHRIREIRAAAADAAPRTTKPATPQAESISKKRATAEMIARIRATVPQRKA